MFLTTEPQASRLYLKIRQEEYWKEGCALAEVQVQPGESIESALKRFKKKIQKAGILSEIKRREHYVKPSVKKKRKSESARKRSR